VGGVTICLWVVWTSMRIPRGQEARVEGRGSLTPTLEVEANTQETGSEACMAGNQV